MDLYKKIFNEISNAKKYNHKFIGVYERSYITSLSGETVIDAIKYFNSCYNSTLRLLYNIETEEIFKSKENDEPDVRGYFNHSFYDSKNQLIFNEDDLSKPLVKLLPSKIDANSEHGYIDRDGNYWKCGVEGHKYLATELFISKTIEKPEKYNEYKSETYLDKMGWIKISSKNIHYLQFFDKGIVTRLTQKQKKTIVRWMAIIGDPTYEFQYGTFKTPEKIEILLEEL